MRPRLRGAWLLTAVLIPIGAIDADAQSVSDSVVVEGSVFDIQQGTGVVQARLQFFPEGVDDFEETRPAMEVLAGSGGSFRTPKIPAGVYHVRVTALGYQDFVQSVNIEGPTVTSLTIRLVPEAMELEPILVEGIRSARLDRWGFYERQARGSAAYFTRAEIEQRNPSRISDMFRTIAGVRVNDPGQGQGPPILVFRGTCRPDVVIDGVNLGWDVRLDEVVVPRDVEGMEVYRGLGGPMEYTMGCGSIVVWTADPTARLREARHPDDFPAIKSFAAAAVFVTVSLLLGR